MPIAVTARIRPSRFFSFCTFAMTALVFLTGLLVLSGQAGTFSFPGRLTITVVSLVSAVLFVRLHFLAKKSFRIDISGNGQIHIRADAHNVPEKFSRAKRDVADTGVFYLDNGSVIWPMLLLLCLRSDLNQKRFFMIFSDSAGKEAFKSLYVACRWLTVHQKNGGIP